MKKEEIQKNLIRQAFSTGKATSIENVDGMQIAQNIKDHGWAEIIECVPYKEGLDR